MKTYIFFFFGFLYCSCLSGQIFQSSEVKKYQSLIEEVYLLSVFVDTDEDIWTSEEVDYFYSELHKSQQWIMNQANDYGLDLKFIDDHFIDNKRVIQLSEIRFLKNLNKTQKKIFNELGYDDFDDFLEETDFDFKTKRLKLLVFVKSRNRSHAYNQWSNTKLDVAFIYCQKTFGALTDQYVISHEMLHQFGAWDLYYGESQREEQADRAKELFPRSIMISTSMRKDFLEVDSLTAWRIGWHNDLKDEYLSFTPQRRNRTDLRFRTGDGSRILFDYKEVGKRRREKRKKYNYQEILYTSWHANPSLNISTHEDARVAYTNSGRWRIGGILSDKFSLESGIDISRVGYRIRKTLDSTYVRRGFFGQSDLYEDVPVNLNFREQFRSFPLQLNYKGLKNKHLEIHGYFSVILNRYRWSHREGQYYYKTLDEFRARSTYDVFSRKSSAMSYEIGGMARMKLFGRFSLIGGVNYHHLFHGRETFRSSEDWQYFKLGALLGLRYELKRKRFEKL